MNDDREDSAALLASLMDEARELSVLKRNLGRTADGPAWLRPWHARGVRIAEEGGGWRCAVDLADVPEGAPRAVVSPPLPDRRSAEDFAIDLLVDALLAHPGPAPSRPASATVPGTPREVPAAAPVPSADPAPAPPSPGAGFEYDGVVHPIPVRAARELMAAGVGMVSEDYVRRRLDEVRRDLAGGGRMTHEALSVLSPDNRRVFLNVCTMATLKGIARWPETGQA